MIEKQLRRELDAVYASFSWRLTWPLRQLSALLRFSTAIRVEIPVPQLSLSFPVEDAVIENKLVALVPLAFELEGEPETVIAPVEAGLSPQEKRIFNELHSLIEKNRYAHSH